MRSSEDILWALDKYGGSFEKALGEAYRRADMNNKARLRNTFPEIWEKYQDERWYASRNDLPYAVGL